MTEDTTESDRDGEPDAATDVGSNPGEPEAGEATAAETERETVDAGTVEHVADLARVNLEGGERERFVGQFADILEYFETLDEVPEVERDPELTNVMRPDEVRESLDRAETLRNAPETEDGQFKGPRVS
jgi:aspartyl-tRNA(Asn)/glutamyl-tRNA(Gln) amidotransferase subunit C